MAPSRPNRAFSLIELLTVIAIVAILLAIIVPIVGGARNSADRAPTKVQFNQWAAAMELYRQEWRSVGGLQHLPFLAGPVYNVGNSWGTLNDWFDRYHFSDPEDDSVAAQTNTQPAVFNLNSSRSAAWQAVLRGMGTGGAAFSFTTTTHNADSEISGNSIEPLTTPISRLSQSAGDIWGILPVSNNFQSLLRQYRRGLRGLTEAQADGLAQQVARNVQRRISAQGRSDLHHYK